MEDPSAKKPKTASVPRTPRRYELLRAASGFKQLGIPGGQGGVFEGKSKCNTVKEAALKVFFVGQELAAEKEAVRLPGRPLCMAAANWPCAPARQAMLVAANDGQPHENILGLVEENPLIKVDENVDSYVRDGRTYSYSHDAIVLPKAGGGDFFDYALELLAPTMDLARARGFFTQMIAGVGRLHELGIAHLDLKLENMLIDAKRTTLMISDFGLAEKVPTTGTDAGRLSFQFKRGSPSYAPPEVCFPDDFADNTDGFADNTDGFAVDVWTLGVALSVLVLGSEPFKTPSKKAMFTAMRDAQDGGQNGLRVACGLLAWKVTAVKHFNALPPTLQSLLDGMLRVRPEKRPTISQVAEYPWVVGSAVPAAAGALAPAAAAGSTYRSAAALEPRYVGLSALADSDEAASDAGYRAMPAIPGEADLPQPPPVERCYERTLV